MNEIIDKLRFTLTKKQKVYFIFISILMLITSFLELVSIGFLIPIVSIIVDGDLNNSYFDLYFLKNFTQSFSKKELILFAFSFFILLFFIKFLFNLFFLYKKNKYVFTIRNYLSKKIFKSFLNRPYDFHQSSNTSKLAINCKYEIEVFTHNILLAELELLTDVTLTLFLVFLLFYIELNITIFTIAIFFLFIYLYQLILKKRSKVWAEERQRFDALINKIIQEGLGSIKEIILSFKEKFFIKKLKYYLERNGLVAIRQQMTQEMPRPLMEFMAIIGFVIIFFILNSLNYNFEKILTLLSIFAAVSFKLLPSLNRIMSNIQRFRAGLPVINFIYSELKSTNISDENINFEKSQHEDVIYLKKLIEVQNLSFSYIDKFNKKNIFENCNLEINKGDYIGLVGSSGIGKSTFLNIISGLIKTYEGKILIDNKDIKILNKKWTQRVAYISQTPFFLDETIKNNIAFAEDEINIDDTKVWKALEAAQLFNFVNSSKDKLNTFIGEQGTKMSAGQLQRLAISRALYEDFDLIILDESLNALDSENESKILNVLKNLKQKNKTIILISHHLSNLRDCNKILQIKDKKIFEKL